MRRRSSRRLLLLALVSYFLSTHISFSFFCLPSNTADCRPSPMCRLAPSPSCCSCYRMPFSFVLLIWCCLLFGMLCLCFFSSCFAINPNRYMLDTSFVCKVWPTTQNLILFYNFFFSLNVNHTFMLGNKKKLLKVLR